MGLHNNYDLKTMKKTIILTVSVIALLFTSCSGKTTANSDLEFNYETSIYYSSLRIYGNLGDFSTVEKMVDAEFSGFGSTHTRNYKASKISSLEEAYAAGDAALKDQLEADYQDAENLYNSLKTKIETGTAFGDYSFKISDITIVQRRMIGEDNILKSVSKGDLSYNITE